MKKVVGLFFFSMIICTALCAQEATVNDLISAGIKSHDKGNYAAAISFYKKALLLDNRSAHANYETAASYFALKDYKNVIKHCDHVIGARSGYEDLAYILKGSALDFLGKPAEAIKIYKAGLKKHTGNHLLYYNLAITSFNVKAYNDAEDALQQSLKLNPAHASSHFLLGLLMITQEKRVPGMLAIYNYLLLEPKDKRTASALKTLEEEWERRVKKESEQNTAITIPGKKDTDEFYTAELMLDLLKASKSNETNKGKTASQLFVENTHSFFTILGEMKKDKKGFWWNFYVDYFTTLAANKHTEAFCYYITQSKEEVYSKWVKDNFPKFETFSDWYQQYLHKY